MGLIITSFLVLLLWDEVGNIIENFRSKKEVADPVINLTATQAPWYVWDVNGPMDDMHHGKKDGEVLRRVYPYSVVDGGVHSVQELRFSHRAGPCCCQTLFEFQTGQSKSNRSQAQTGTFMFRIGLATRFSGRKKG